MIMCRIDDAREVPVNAAGGSYGNWACPRFFRTCCVPAGRSPIGTYSLTTQTYGPAPLVDGGPEVCQTRQRSEGDRHSHGPVSRGEAELN